MGFGGDASKGHLLTFEFSTHMLNPIGIARSLHAIGNTKGLKRGHIYEQRVREAEHASFTPLVLAATGGMANEATHFFKRLASLLAIHRDQLYNSTMASLRCRLNFSLLRSAIQCIRGSRSSRGFACKTLHHVFVRLVNRGAR